MVATPRNEDGLDQSIICYGRDITEKHKLELQVQRSQRLENMGILSGSMAHDFNNLLTPISGYAELIKAASSEKESRFAYAENILAVSRTASDLIKKLLLFSKKETVKYKEIQVNALLADFYNLGRSFLRKNISLEIKACNEDLFIYGDCVQIEQVLVNLILNAQDAIEHDGTIIIKSARIDHPDVEVDDDYYLLPAASYCRLTVEDTGVGMDKETLNKLFDPFFTTKARKRKRSGPVLLLWHHQTAERIYIR